MRKSRIVDRTLIGEGKTRKQFERSKPMRLSYTRKFGPRECVQYDGPVSMDDSWTREESALAMVEGWDLFEAVRIEIQRDDESLCFPSDEAARDYVSKCAEKGSRLHAKAWTLHVRGRMT